MAPHEQSFSFLMSSNNHTTNVQSFDSLFNRSDHWKCDSKIKNQDLFQKFEIPMEEHSIIANRNSQLLETSNFYTLNDKRDVFMDEEPEDRLAMSFAAALSTDHRDQMMASIDSHPVHLRDHLSESVWRYGCDNDADAWIPPSGARFITTEQDFLSSCNFCYRNLANHDIFMYRGDKAFCSHECRQQHILMVERNSDLSRKFSMIPCID